MIYAVDLSKNNAFQKIEKFQERKIINVVFEASECLFMSVSPGVRYDRQK
jgi:hypothetical protein